MRFTNGAKCASGCVGYAGSKAPQSLSQSRQRPQKAIRYRGDIAPFVTIEQAVIGLRALFHVGERDCFHEVRPSTGDLLGSVG